MDGSAETVRKRQTRGASTHNKRESIAYELNSKNVADCSNRKDWVPTTVESIRSMNHTYRQTTASFTVASLAVGVVYGSLTLICLIVTPLRFARSMPLGSASSVSRRLIQACATSL
jgi:hypothetical protein